jgi:hypothetical protein
MRANIADVTTILLQRKIRVGGAVLNVWKQIRKTRQLRVVQGRSSWECRTRLAPPAMNYNILVPDNRGHFHGLDGLDVNEGV